MGRTWILLLNINNSHVHRSHLLTGPNPDSSAFMLNFQRNEAWPRTQDQTCSHYLYKWKLRRNSLREPKNILILVAHMLNWQIHCWTSMDGGNHLTSDSSFFGPGFIFIGSVYLWYKTLHLEYIFFTVLVQCYPYFSFSFLAKSNRVSDCLVSAFWSRSASLLRPCLSQHVDFTLLFSIIAFHHSTTYQPETQVDTPTRKL